MSISRIFCPYCGRLHNLPPNFTVVHGYPSGTIQCGNVLCRQVFDVIPKLELTFVGVKQNETRELINLPYANNVGNITPMKTQRHMADVNVRYVENVNDKLESLQVPETDIYLLPTYKYGVLYFGQGFRIKLEEITQTEEVESRHKSGAE